MRRDLYSIGYSSLPVRMRACEVGLPHERLRCFIVAHADSERLWELQRWLRGACGNGKTLPPQACKYGIVAHIDSKSMEWASKSWGECVSGTIEPTLGRGVHGVSRRVDRIKAIGNSIVPQLAAVLMEGIKRIDELCT